MAEKDIEEKDREETVSAAQAKRDVVIMAERLALLYHAFVQAMAAELGEEKALAITDQAIAAYGQACGSRTRALVEKAGAPNDLAHLHLGADLPSQGWEAAAEEADDRHLLIRTTYCPFAAASLELGHPAWARHYCQVDQAKYAAYNEDLACVHEENILDGAAACLMRVWLQD